MHSRQSTARELWAPVQDPLSPPLPMGDPGCSLTLRGKKAPWPVCLSWLECCRFDSPSGHIPRLWVWALVQAQGHVMGAYDHQSGRQFPVWVQCIQEANNRYFSLSFPLSLKAMKKNVYPSLRIKKNKGESFCVSHWCPCLAWANWRGILEFIQFQKGHLWGAETSSRLLLSWLAFW